MKIERVNDHQIRCTLTQEDLAQREIKLSELAYGSEKAKLLFRDMMQQASIDLGFEAEDIPIMVEAIPLSPDTIVLIITKVESPEELDTRFSNFTQFEDDSDMAEEIVEENPLTDTAAPDMTSEILDLFNRLKKDATEVEKKPDTATVQKTSQVHIYMGETLEDMIVAAQALGDFYHEANTLYKNPKTNLYYLVLHQGKCDNTEFSKVNNLLTSYLAPQKYSAGILAYYEEHYKKIIAKHALESLAKL